MLRARRVVPLYQCTERSEFCLHADSDEPFEKRIDDLGLGVVDDTSQPVVESALHVSIESFESARRVVNALGGT